MLWNKLHCLPKFIYWSPNPQYLKMWLTVFENRNFKGIIKVKRGYMAVLKPVWPVSYKRTKLGHRQYANCGITTGRYMKGWPSASQGEKFQKKPNCPHLILIFSHPKIGVNNFLLLKPSKCGVYYGSQSKLI